MNRPAPFYRSFTSSPYKDVMDGHAFSPSHEEFDPGIDYKSRRASRTPVDEATRLSRSATWHVEVHVRNLSPCGFMAECGEAVGIGSYVTLDIPGLGKVDAQVRWQVGTRMGGMFTDPISLSRCEWTGERTNDA